MQEPLPLALTQCSRAYVKQPPPPLLDSVGSGGRVSGWIGQEKEKEEGQEQCGSLAAKISYRTAYRCVSSEHTQAQTLCLF